MGRVGFGYVLSLLALAMTAASGPSPGHAPSVGVVVSRRSATSVNKAMFVARRVSDFLAEEGVPVTSDPDAVSQSLRTGGFRDSADCKAKRPCIAHLGTMLGMDVLVAVEVASVSETIAIHLEAVSVADARAIAIHDFVTKESGTADVYKSDVAVFAKKLQPKLDSLFPKAHTAPSPVSATTAAASPGTPDVPVKAADPTASIATPVRVASQTDVAVSVEPKQSSRVPAWALAGGGVVALGTAGVFGAIASGQKAQLACTPAADGTCTINLPLAQAQRVAASANTNLTVALVTLVAAGVLGAASGWFFATSGSSRPDSQP